jgi:hypothetical protein
MEWEQDEEDEPVPACTCNQSLQGGKPTQHPLFNRSIERTRTV